MSLNLVASISIIVLTIGLLVIFWYVIQILANIRRILKPIDRMATEIEKELTPLVNDIGGITSSLRNFFGRIDRISGLVFGKLDFMAQGFERISVFFQNFVRNPKVEIESLAAGIRKAIEVLTKRKEEKDNG